MVRRANSQHVFGFVGGEARLWEGCSRSAYVLGILDGVAMLWFDVLNVQGHTIKGGKWLEEKNNI